MGKMGCRNPKAKRGKRLWVGTFTNFVVAAHAYDEAAMILYGSCARLNFPAGLDSTTTSNYSEIPLRNEDGESIATSSAVEEDLPELFNDDFFKDMGSFFEDIGQLGCLDVNDGQLGCLDVDQCEAPSGVS
ncbi:dehydration-responsive element-binding protein 2C-like [Corylus avellana]|uniref:dehydration-responsive element-binding protein 2C-like n=1 Tax=Corylus avellana TaxID=13451 RepID=UPI00286C779A|nr:dehydration-responsive element-binding protein 2C-like [Corylus avellana]